MRFEGIYTALVTPFSSSGSGVDESILRNLLERQIEAKITGVILGGSTGEGQTLASSEFKDLVRIGLLYRDQIQVLAACGSPSTRQTCESFKHWADTGVHGVLISSPSYNRAPQRGLVAHFQQVCESASHMPVMVYNIPSRTSVNILPTSMQEIWKIKNVAALKESSGQWEQALELRQSLPPEKTLLAGDDSMTLPFLSIGGHGTVSVLANLLPKAMMGLFEASKSGDGERAWNLQMQLNDLMRWQFIESNPIPMKWLLGQLLKLNLSPRLPLVTLEAIHHEKLDAALKQALRFGLL